MSSAADDLLKVAHEQLARGDEAAGRGDADEARASYDRALAGFRSVEGDGDRLDSANFGQAEALRRLGDLAERAELREEARENYVAALPLLAELLPRNPDLIRPRTVYLFMQVARLDALADQPQAEQTFRAALQLAERGPDGRIRSTIWHYIGAYCERRRLPIASFLAYQQSLDELPEEAGTAALLSEVRHQLWALQELQEMVPSLAIVRLLERHDALADDTLTVDPSAQILDQMGFAPDVVSQLTMLLDKPANVATLRDETVERMRAAVPEFARRFVDGELHLEDTRAAVLPPSQRE